MMNLAAIIELLGLVAEVLERHRDDPDTRKALDIVGGLMAAVRAGDGAATAAAIGQLRTHVRANVTATDAAIDADLMKKFRGEDT